MKGLSERGALALVLGVTALAWLPALWGGFVWDDINNLVNSDRLGAWSAIWESFRQPAMWSAATEAGAVPTWRPLALASFALDRQIYGPGPFGHHLASVLWHLLATWGVLALFLRFFNPLRAAVLTLAFALHPACAEAVAWINGRSEIFALVGGAWALVVAHDGRTRRRLTLLLPLLAVALMAKETGLVFAPLLVAFTWISTGAAGRSGRPLARLPFAAIIAATTTAVLLLRFQAAPPPTAEAGLLGALPALPSVYFRCLQATLVPLDLGIATLGPWIESLSTTERVLHGAITLALVLAPLGLWWRGQRLAAFGLAWYLAVLLPAALLAPLGWPGLQRWLYLALPGLLLAAGALLPAVTHLRRAAVATVAGLALLTLQTERAIQVWANEENLYLQTLEEDPTSSLALANLGALLLQRGQYPEAETLLRQAFLAKPRQAGVTGHLVRALARQGKCDLASAHLNLDPEQGPGRVRAEQAVAECRAAQRGP